MYIKILQNPSANIDSLFMYSVFFKAMFFEDVADRGCFFISLLTVICHGFLGKKTKVVSRCLFKELELSLILLLDRLATNPNLYYSIVGWGWWEMDSFKGVCAKMKERIPNCSLIALFMAINVTLRTDLFNLLIYLSKCLISISGL